MSLALERLYGNSIEDKNRNKFDKTKFDNAIEELHNHSGKIDIDLLDSEAVRQMTHETYSLLSGGIEKGIAEGLQQGIIQEINPEVVYALQNNAFIFSGLKSYHTLTEVGLSITDDKGQIKPFQTFLENVRQIHEKYNVAYLNAEYKHAVASSQMAAKWHEIETEKERYDLQYRTAGDNLVREEHAALNGVTLPADDPFWDKYYPPNGWGCRCTAIQVRKGKYQTTLDSAQAIEAGDMATARPKEAIFRTNAGKTLKIYPDKHPYYKAPKAVKAEIEKQAEEIVKPQQAVDFVNTSEERRKWFEREFKSLKLETNPRNNGSTDMTGTIWMSKPRMNGILSGLTKLRRNQEITVEEADALATFWHEITHNRNKPGNMYLTSAQTRYMELANEFVARKTLPEFYKAFGSNIQHPDFMNNRSSTGYNTMVNNYDYVINRLGLNKDEVLKTVKNNLFDEKYTEQQTGLAQGLIDGGLQKKEIAKNGSEKIKQPTISAVKKLVGICKDTHSDYKLKDGEYKRVTAFEQIEEYIEESGFVGVSQ